MKMRELLMGLVAVAVLATGCEDDTNGDCPNPEHPARYTLVDRDQGEDWTVVDADGDGVVCLSVTEYPVVAGRDWAPVAPSSYPVVGG